MSSELSVEEKVEIITSDLEGMGISCSVKIGTDYACIYAVCPSYIHNIILTDGNLNINKGIGWCISGSGITLYRGDTFSLGIGKNEIQSLGIDDIFNLKPHEYGILKLKCGLEKHHLYIPEFYIDEVKFMWERQG